MSRNTIFWSGAVLIMILVGLYAVMKFEPKSQIVIENNTNIPTENLNEVQIYSDAEIGLSFEYPGDDSYHIDVRSPANESGKQIRSITLIDSNEYENFISSPDAREGPPAITIEVYENNLRRQSKAWAEANPTLSNISLAFGDVRETLVDGANAVRYLVDGLYPTDTSVVAHGSFIYIISGSYLDESDPTKTDFEPLLVSITFIPESGM